MANSVTTIMDTQKKLLVKFTGDASEAATLKIDAGGLKFSLNANNQILGAGTDRKTAYHLYLKSLAYDVQSGDTRGYVKLFWDQAGLGANSNTLISLSGSGEQRFNNGGEPYTVPNANTTASGNVWLQTVGFSGNCAYTIIADFRKHPTDYDQGQTADPSAFGTPPIVA